MKPNNKLKAVFNPITRELAVKYGNTITRETFKELDEWTIVSFNSDDTHPNYLHVHLHYDETCQLLFYPRVDGSENLNESLGVYWNSGERKNRKIKIVYTDKNFNDELIKL